VKIQALTAERDFYRQNLPGRGLQRPPDPAQPEQEASEGDPPVEPAPAEIPTDPESPFDVLMAACRTELTDIRRTSERITRLVESGRLLPSSLLLAMRDLHRRNDEVYARLGELSTWSAAPDSDPEPDDDDDEPDDDPDDGEPVPVD
jgi:hypothetical protein